MGTSMRLNGFPALRAACFEEVQGVLADKGLQAERRGAGETARFNAVYRDGWYLAHMDYDMPLRIAAPAERDDYALYLPLAGAVRASDGRDSIACGRDLTAMTSPCRPLETLTTAFASRINLSLKRDVMMQHLTALLGDEPARAPVFALAFDRTQPETRAYLHYLWGVVSALEQDPQFLDRPMIGASVEQALVTGLLLTQPHDLSERLARPGCGPAPADVRRVIEYIHAHLADEITLADLVAVARVPARTLQSHFQAQFGCGPMAYLRERRLCRAHEELRAGAEGITVTDVALRWGFGSLGRFAGAYRARFGEVPSQTLRGNRH